MIKANDLIDQVVYVYNLPAGYIWGEAGNTWTAAKQRASKREMTVKYGSKWIGYRVWDCSGLIMWAFAQCGIKGVYHGSNTQWAKFTNVKGKLKNGKPTDGHELRPGSGVFLCDENNSRHHVGLYIGNGKVIEARGTYYGVVMTDVSRWDEWAEWKDVDYEGAMPVAVKAILKRGDKGEDVLQLQHLLNLKMYNAGVEDGIFGKNTEAAVKLLQADYGLKVDGIVGKDTWAVLLADEPVKPETPGVQDAVDALEQMKVQLNSMIYNIDSIINRLKG